MAAALALIWIALCAPIVVFFVLGVDQQLRFNYSLIAQIVAPFMAAFFCYHTASAFPRMDSMNKILKFLGTGVLCWGIGAILYALYPLFHEGQETPFPWYSDIGYLLLVPFILMGLIFFKRTFGFKIPVFGKVGGAFFFLVAFSLSVQFNLAKLKDSDSLASYVATLGYVLGDPLLLAGTMMVVSILTGPTARPWWLILIGLIFYYLGDLVYNYLSIQGEYGTGHPIDITWPLAFGFIAVAALVIRTRARYS